MSQDANRNVYVFEATVNSSETRYSVHGYKVHLPTMKRWTFGDISEQPITQCTFTRDNQFVLGARNEDIISAWYLSSGEHYRDFRFLDSVTFLAVTSDNQWLVAMTERGVHRIKVWNFQTGELLIVTERVVYNTRGVARVFDGCPHEHCCITTDGNYFIVGYRSGFIVFNLPQLQGLQNENTSEISSLTTAQDPDEKKHVVVIGNRENGYISVFHFDSTFTKSISGKKINAFPNNIDVVVCRLAYGGRMLLVTGKYNNDNGHTNNACIKIYDTTTGMLYNAETHHLSKKK